MPPSRWWLYAGLLLSTCSMLLAQQFLTRVFAIQFNSGLAFLAISVTFLGLGSAGGFVYMLPNVFALERLPRLIPRLATGHAVCLVVGFACEALLERAADGTGGDALASQIVRVLVASLCLLPAMFLAGLVISLVLRANSQHVGRLYGADLLGGGIGCLLVLPLMEWLGGDHGIFAIGGLAALGAVLLAHAHGAMRAAAAPGVFAVLLLAMPAINGRLGLIDIRSHRTVMGGVADWVKEDRELARDWNAMSRLGFFETVDESSIYVRIDSSCQTTIPAKDPKKIEKYVADTGFERIPFVLDRHRRCLEIGAGGGRGMVLAKAMGAEQVTGVEINPGIVEAALGVFPGFGVDDLVRDQRCRLVLGEGRSFTEGCTDRFDSVTITFIQTNVANGSAAFALSEANLFTTEAFMGFLGKLDTDGLFYVYRHAGVECLRMISILREAYARLGLGDLRERLYLVRDARNNVLVLASRSPLAPAELQRLDAAVQQLQLEVLYAPGAGREARPTNPFPQRMREARQRGDLAIRDVAQQFRQLAHDPQFEPIEASYVRAADPAAYAADCVVDIRATDDDRPYFFFTGLARLRDFLLYFDSGGTSILGGIVMMLVWMGVAFTVLVAMLIALPLLVRRPAARAGRGAGLGVVLYFAGIGMGYIAVQISFIQRFVLFLGHPVYAISVVLLAFLLSSGLGSACSERLLRGRGGLAAPVVALAVVLLAYNALLPSLFHSSAIAWSVPAKIALSVALIFVLAFPMGMFFPQGIRLCERAAPELVPWAWGANSAASVIGSILALTLAIHTGFTVVAVVAVAIYVLTVLPAAALLRRAAAA